MTEVACMAWFLYPTIQVSLGQFPVSLRLQYGIAMTETFDL